MKLWDALVDIICSGSGEETLTKKASIRERKPFPLVRHEGNARGKEMPF